MLRNFPKATQLENGSCEIGTQICYSNGSQLGATLLSMGTFGNIQRYFFKLAFYFGIVLDLQKSFRNSKKFPIFLMPSSSY